MIVNRSTRPGLVVEQADRFGPAIPRDMPRSEQPRRRPGELQTKAEAQQIMEAKALAKSRAPAKPPVSMNSSIDPVEGIGRGGPPPGAIKVR
jgi:hypothetical protein